MNETSIEMLSLALVREYLSRKGYKATLYTFDDESQRKDYSQHLTSAIINTVRLPEINYKYTCFGTITIQWRNSNCDGPDMKYARSFFDIFFNKSIQNRKTLAEQLKLLDLVKANKTVGKNQLKCFLDMIVKYFKEQRMNGASKSGSGTKLLKSCDSPNFILKEEESGNHVVLPRVNSTTEDGNHCEGCRCNKDKDDAVSGIRRRTRRRSSDVSKDKICSNDTVQEENSNHENPPVREESSNYYTVQNTSSKNFVEASVSTEKSTSCGDVTYPLTFIEELRKKKKKNHCSENHPMKYLISEDRPIESPRQGHNELAIKSPIHETESIRSHLIKDSHQRKKKRKSINASMKENDDLSKTLGESLVVDDVVEDFDAFDFHFGSGCITELDAYDKLYTRIEKITLEVAIELKTLVFGSPACCFNFEWLNQGFNFSQHPDLAYGLIQEKGGPCGLLAAVQAWILFFLLTNESKGMVNKVPSPTKEEQICALTKALTCILWLVSDTLRKETAKETSNRVIVVLSSNMYKFRSATSEYKVDGVTEKLDLYFFENRQKLYVFLKNNITTFCGRHGVVLFLYSAILSCGIENIQNSMDEAKGTLIGNHGYCAQEMVNMLLTGDAVSNTFDNCMELGEGEEKMVLRGIAKVSCIGFLSLFEHYQSCEVGMNYKQPRFPIWVVYSESHFSVLFAIYEIRADADRTFDLYYYDGLGNQDEEIRLTISLDSSDAKVPNEDTDLIPPLDHCIRTRWKEASVSWNDTDPLL